jgi:hypothetical protein
LDRERKPPSALGEQHTGAKIIMNATFKIGQTYTARSACDYNCIFSFKVLKRSAKFLTIEHNGDTKRVGIKQSDHGEWALPLGRYSMAPVINA